MLQDQKARFEIEPGVAYFNCSFMAPMLRTVHAAATEAVARTARPWTISPQDFFTHAERARELIAQLIGASADDIAIVPSVSYGIGVAAQNLRIERGRAILVLAEQFPSNVYPWRALAERAGAELVTVPRPADGDWTTAVLAHITDRVGIAALPNCHWTDGARLDLVRIGAALRAVGAALALDLMQSLGVHPFDVREVQPDFVACASYKWLLGPYSLGFLYAAPRHHAGVPLEHNWIARERSEHFAGLVDYRDALQPGARRYDMGERANFILLPMLIAALEQILAWTPEAISRTVGARNQRIAEALAALGAQVLPAAHRVDHILGVRFDDGALGRIMDGLRAERIIVSMRGTTMRVATHLCVDDADVDRLIDTVRRLRS